MLHGSNILSQQVFKEPSTSSTEWSNKKKHFARMSETAPPLTDPKYHQRKNHAVSTQFMEEEKGQTNCYITPSCYIPHMLHSVFICSHKTQAPRNINEKNKKSFEGFLTSTCQYPSKKLISQSQSPKKNEKLFRREEYMLEKKAHLGS